MASTWWWWFCWKCFVFIGAVESAAACRRSSSSSSYISPKRCTYFYDIRTLDCTDVTLRILTQGHFGDHTWQIQYLLLGNTQLKTLNDNVFSSVPNIIYLNMSKNFLEFLGFQTFRYLTKLRTLDLSNNLLASLHDELLFQSQANLRSLILSNNKLRTLDSIVLDPLKSITMLVLSGNPFVCNCQLRLTMEWCSNKYLETKATCELPRKYSGSRWSVLNMSDICQVSGMDSEINTTEYGSATEYASTEYGSATEYASTDYGSAIEYASTTERSEGNTTAQEWNADTSVTMVTVYVCVAVLLLCVGVIMALYFWKNCRQGSIWDTKRSENNLTDRPCSDYYTDINPDLQNMGHPASQPDFPGSLSSGGISSNAQSQKSNEIQLYDYPECNTIQQNNLTGSELLPKNNTLNATEEFDPHCLYSNPLYVQTYE